MARPSLSSKRVNEKSELLKGVSQKGGAFFFSSQFRFYS